MVYPDVERNHPEHQANPQGLAHDHKLHLKHKPSCFSYFFWQNITMLLRHCEVTADIPKQNKNKNY